MSTAPAEHDPVNHPSHYVSHPSGIECLKITRLLPFDLGNAIKYVWRAELKDGMQAFEKAEFYMDDFHRYPPVPSPSDTQEWGVPRLATELLREVIIAEPDEFKRRFFSLVAENAFAKAGRALTDYLNKLRDEAAEAEQNAAAQREAFFEKYPAMKRWENTAEALIEEAGKRTSFAEALLKPSEAVDPNGTVLFEDATAEKEPDPVAERPSGAHPVMFNGKPTGQFAGWCAKCQKIVRPQFAGLSQAFKGKDAEHYAESAVKNHIAAEHPFEG